MSNRQFYPSQAAFVSQSPSTGAASTGIQQLVRIQSFGISENIARENVTELGRFGLVDQVIVNPPTVNMELTWLVNGVSNESGIGFSVAGTSGVLSNIINGSQLDKNYYITMAPEGIGAEGYTGNSSVIGVGNGIVGSYSTQGRVGGFPSASIRVEGLDLKTDIVSTNIDPPCVNPVNGAGITGIAVTLPSATTGNGGISVVRPSEIQVTLSNPFNIQNYCPQGYSIQANFNLVPQICLGNRFPYTRVITFPVEVSVSIETFLRDIQPARLSQFICSDVPTNININLYGPGCSGVFGNLMAGYTLTNCKFDSEAFNSAVGQQNTTVPLTYRTFLGGPIPLGNEGNFFMSGSLLQ